MLSHNDGYWGNMLLESPSPRIHLIDFELSSVNYLGGDLVQLMSEMMMDYDKEGDTFCPEDLPSVDLINEMIKVMCFFYYRPESFETFAGSMDLRKQLQESSEFRDFEHESVDDMRRAFPHLKRVNDLFWSLRSFYLLMTGSKEASKDYLTYVNERYKIMKAPFPVFI